MAIKWRQGDYIRLGRAVADFNREIAKNETEINKLYLPDKIDYKTLRDKIQTRQGLNDYINSFNRIKLSGAFDLETLEGGEVITTYQRRELDRGKSKAIREASKEIAKLEAQTKINYGIDDDINLPNAFKTQKQKELEAKVKDWRKLYKLTGKDFKRRARELGINATELKYRRAYIFRENYMKVMQEKYGHLDSYKYWLKWARKHRNPISFYESLPDNEYYPDDLQYQSDNLFNETDFIGFIESLGEVVDDKIKKKLKQAKNMKIKK